MQVFTAIAFLFGITAVLSFINDRVLRLQTDIGLLVLAVLTTLVLRVVEVFVPSGVIQELSQLTQSFNLNDTLLKGVLCFMLFRGSVGIRWANLREQRWLVLSLAFAGTAMTCLLTGGLTHAGLALFGVAITLSQALLFGALIAATDPIAALAILSGMGLPKNLETVIDGESLLNDGLAVVLFTIFAGMAIGSSASAWSDAGSIFIREVLGGAVLGVFGWLILHILMLRADTYHTTVLVTLGAVACLYATAQHLHVSGPIATVVAGLLSGYVTKPQMREETTAPLRTFWTGLDGMLNALLFVFVGFHVVLINPLTGVIPGVPAVVAILAMLIARALTVLAIVGALSSARVIRADCLGLTKLLTWGGLRGGLSLALAVSLPDSVAKPLILNMTFAVVVFSIVVQGLTIRRMFTVLCGAPHNAVYAESMIMRSPRRQSGGRRGVGARITPHNSSISRHLAWSGACRVLRSDRAVASVLPFNATAASTARTVNYAERDVRLCQPNHLLNIKIFRLLAADSA